MKKLIILFVLALSLVGCAAVVKALPVIASVIADAHQTMDIIDVAAQEWVRTTNPPDEHRRKYAELRSATLRSLNIANRAVTGAQDIDQKQYDAAFQEFKAAFAELKAFLQERGVMNAGALKSSADGTPEPVPEPLALTHQVE